MIMATINDKLTYLAGTKDAIKQAIITKGVSVADNDTFRSYASKINDIESGGGSATLQDGTKFANSTFTEAQMFDTSNVTSMSDMFNNCSKLTTVPLFDTSNVTSMFNAFGRCSSLTTVPQFNTSKVNDIGTMFSGCSKLTTVPLFDTSNVTNINYMFNNCSSLTTLGGFTGLKLDLGLSYSSYLKVESVMNVITNAADMSSSPKTLTLHANVYAQLSEEQIATAAAKGWNIAEK